MQEFGILEYGSDKILVLGLITSIKLKWVQFELKQNWNKPPTFIVSNIDVALQPRWSHRQSFCKNLMFQ